MPSKKPLIEKKRRRGPPFKLKFTEVAAAELTNLKNHTGLKVRYKAVLTSLAYLEVDPKHPSLNTHEFSSKKGPDNAKVFEAYAQNRTPGAFRIFFCYGPDGDEITILAITSHP
jgi:hypothetical protein